MYICRTLRYGTQWNNRKLKGLRLSNIIKMSKRKWRLLLDRGVYSGHKITDSLGNALRILDLGNRCRWVLCSTLRPHYPRHTLDRWLGRPQIRSEHSGADICRCPKSNSGRSNWSHSLHWTVTLREHMCGELNRMQCVINLTVRRLQLCWTICVL